MHDDPMHGEAGILASFLARLHADMGHGAPRSLKFYQAAFPGFEALIAREYAAMFGADSADSDLLELQVAASEARRIGAYRILKSLGRGGQGEVFLAKDERLKRRVALKLLHPWVSPGLLGLERFRREATIASRLDHPGLCTVYEAGIEDDQPFIAMRFIEGQSLAERLSAAKAQQARTDSNSKRAKSSHAPSSRGEFEAIARLMELAARAAHAAHEAGVVHRDLKPGNILIAAGEQPVLLDFGLARDEQAEALTRTGEVFGTPEYMAPEQLLGASGGVDARADVYSLGATLYECLTLRRPFAASSREALYRAVLESRAPDPRKINPALPTDLIVILETAMEKERTRRYATALDFAEDLRRFIAHEPIRARRIGPLARATRWVRREPARAALLVAATAVLSAGVFVARSWPRLRAELNAEQRLAENEPQLQAALLVKQRFEASESLERALEEAYLHLGEETDTSPIDSFRAILDRDPTNVDALAGLVLAFAWFERIAEAREVLRTHAALVEERPELGWAEVELLRLEGREQEASERAQALEARVDSSALFLRGLGELERGHRGEAPAFARAESHLRRAVLSAPVARRIYHYVYAHAVGHGGSEDARREVAETLRRLWPDSAIARYWAQYAVGDLQTAAENAAEWRAIIELRASDARLWNNLGKTLHEAGDLEASLAAHEEALRLRPNYAVCLFNYGNALMSAERFAEAERAFLRSIELRPHNNGALTNLASLYRRTGRHAEALPLHEEQTRARPLDPMAWSNLAGTYRVLKRYEEAERAFERSLALKPRPGTYVQIGLMQRDRRQYEQALQSFLSAIELDANFGDAHRHRGLLLHRMNRSDEARAALNEALRCDPDDMNARSYLGAVDLAEGDVASGLKHQTEVIERRQDLSNPYSLRAECLLELGRTDAALVDIERACKLELDYLQNRRVRGRVYLWLGRSAEALTEFELGQSTPAELERAKLAVAVESDWALVADPHDLPVEPAVLEVLAILAAARGEHRLAWLAFQALEAETPARMTSADRPLLAFAAARAAVQVAAAAPGTEESAAACASAWRWLERLRLETKVELSQRLAADAVLARLPDLLATSAGSAATSERWAALIAPR